MCAHHTYIPVDARVAVDAKSDIVTDVISQFRQVVLHGSESRMVSLSLQQHHVANYLTILPQRPPATLSACHLAVQVEQDPVEEFRRGVGRVRCERRW